MIRFLPDSWIEAVARPFVMALPDANIYVEIAAPDIRLAAIVLAALALAAAMLAKRVPDGPKPALLLLGFLGVSMALWMNSTGNGRYFLPMLLAAGPLCVGLLRLLPMTKGAQVAAASLVLAMQVFVVAESSPWSAWAWKRWNDDSYFHVDLRPLPSAGGTFVTLSSISYSLIIPQFPPDSRWINVATGGSTPRDASFARAVLDASQSLTLIVPSIPSITTPDGQPNAEGRQAFDLMLRPHSMAIKEGAACAFLPSRGLAQIAHRTKGDQDSQDGARYGFWACPLSYPIASGATAEPAAPTQIEQTFAAVERLCPRFFRPGEATTVRLSGGGYLRHYAGSDTKVYVLENGVVTYRFWRSLNQVVIGTITDVVAGRVTIDCSAIRGQRYQF